MKAILLDIEGTTTPIDFVHNTLFPYAKARMGGFILDNLVDLKFEIEQLAEEHTGDGDYKGEFRPDSPNSVSDYLKFLIDKDRKSTPLKTIQGLIWQTGYRSGEIVSPVYDDVPEAFRRWKAADKTIAIYSSGSALAQQLLFRHTDHGNLAPSISNFFDTAVGGKREVESYHKIANELGLQPAEIVFISDITAELDAARTSGLQTVLSVRPGNAPVDANVDHRIVENFDGLE